MFCECGCGQKAPIATKNCERYGWVKGQPKRFIIGHRARLYFKEANPRWRGGVILRNGYWRIRVPEHPNADASGYVKRCVLIAESALGRHLKKGEVVHHINKDKTNDSNSNLLICDKRYHGWLHAAGANNYRYGVTVSKETRDKISASQKARLQILKQEKMNGKVFQDQRR